MKRFRAKSAAVIMELLWLDDVAKWAELPAELRPLK